MRKVTQDIVNAFRNKEKRTIGNSSTHDGRLFLHGNEIARWNSSSQLAICHCGWKTVTTKERLNGIPGISVYQKNYKWFLNGKPWNTLSALVNVVSGEIEFLDERI